MCVTTVKSVHVCDIVQPRGRAVHSLCRTHTVAPLSPPLHRQSWLNVRTRLQVQVQVQALGMAAQELDHLGAV